MENKYLDDKGLEHVSEKFKHKLSKSDTIPEASSELEGKQILYTGDSSNGYIRGKIYTCLGLEFYGEKEYGWFHTDPYVYGYIDNGKFYDTYNNEIVGDDGASTVETRYEDCLNVSTDVYCMRFNKFVPLGSYMMDRDLTTFITPDIVVAFPQAADLVARDGKPIRYRHTGPTTDDLVYGYFYELKRIEIEPVGTENPKNLKWLEFITSSDYQYHSVSMDTTVNPSKTYYKVAWVRMDTQPSVDMENYLPTWEGTNDEWEALTDEERAKYVVLHFTDDEDDEDADVIYELDAGSDKPVASSALFNILYYSFIFTAFQPHNTSTYNKIANIIPVMSGECALITIITSTPNNNYVKSEISVANNTIVRTVPSNFESDTNFKKTIYVFVNNTSSNTVDVNYIVYGNASSYGTDESLLYFIKGNLAQSDLRDLIDSYKAQDQAGLAIYLEVN